MKSAGFSAAQHRAEEYSWWRGARAAHKSCIQSHSHLPGERSEHSKHQDQRTPGGGLCGTDRRDVSQVRTPAGSKAMTADDGNREQFRMVRRRYL